MGCARDRGPVHVHMADRVWGGADGVYNRLLLRIGIGAGTGVWVEGVFDLSADDLIAAVDAVRGDR